MPTLAEVFTGENFSFLDQIRDELVAIHKEDPLVSAFTEGRVVAAEAPFPVLDQVAPFVQWSILSKGEESRTSSCTKIKPVFQQLLVWESPFHTLRPGEASAASYFNHSERLILEYLKGVPERLDSFDDYQVGAVPIDESLIVYATSTVVLEVTINTFTRKRT